MMLGAVGAYAWSGTVVHQTGSTVNILPSSAFEETLQDKDHSSLLGMHSNSACMLCSFFYAKKAKLELKHVKLEGYN